MYLGHYPLLEKGPLVKFLGGEDLLKNDFIEDTFTDVTHSKSLVMGVLCLSCALCHFIVSFLRKLHFRLLDRYAPEFNRSIFSKQIQNKILQMSFSGFRQFTICSMEDQSYLDHLYLF